MMRLALGTAALLLALLDWTAGSTIAEPDGPNDGPPPAEMVPRDANLEGMFRATAEIDSVALRIVPAGLGYVLEATNPRDEDRDVEVEVKVLETTVNPMARMAPMPREVANEKVALHCPAHQRIRRPLQLAALERVAPAQANAGSNANQIVFFRTREFLVAPATPAAAAHPQQRQSQRASRDVNAAVVGPFARPAGETVLRLAVAPRAMTVSAQ